MQFQDVSDIFVDQLVANFFVFGETNQMVLLEEVFLLLFVRWHLWYWQVIDLDLREHFIEVLEAFVCRFLIASAADEELTLNWRFSMDILTCKTNWNIEIQDFIRTKEWLKDES